MAQSDIMGAMQRLFARQARNFRNIVTRGVVTAVNDGDKMQSVQVKGLFGEIMDNAERAQNYGFTSHPLNGAEVVIVAVDADRSHPIIVVADDRSCRKLGIEPGEVAIYTHEGDYVHLKKDNEIEVSTQKLVVNATESVSITTKEYTLNAETVSVFGSSHIGHTTPNYGMAGVNGTGSASIQANITQVGSHESTGDQIASGISQVHHPHEGVMPGDGLTGKPV